MKSTVAVFFCLLAAAALAQQNSEKITDSHWRQARKTLKVSGTFEAMDVKTGRERQSVLINGKPYGDGDLISTNHDGNRFTWRVGGITEGSTLRLERIRAKPIPDVKAMTKKDGKEEKKGESKK